MIISKSLFLYNYKFTVFESNWSSLKIFQKLIVIWWSSLSLIAYKRNCLTTLNKFCQKKWNKFSIFGCDVVICADISEWELFCKKKDVALARAIWCWFWILHHPNLIQVIRNFQSDRRLITLLFTGCEWKYLCIHAYYELALIVLCHFIRIDWI